MFLIFIIDLVSVSMILASGNYLDACLAGLSRECDFLIIGDADWNTCLCSNIEMKYYTDVGMFCNHEEGISNCTIDFCQKRQEAGLSSVLNLPLDAALQGINVLEDFQRLGSFLDERIGYEYIMMNWDGRRKFKLQAGSPFRNNTYHCDKHFVYKPNTYPKLQQIHRAEGVNLEAIRPKYHGQLFELTLTEGGIFFGCVMVCGFLLYYIIKIHVHEGTSFCSTHMKLQSSNDTVKEITMTCQLSETSGDENTESCINYMQCPKWQVSTLCRMQCFLCNEKKVSEMAKNMLEERALHGTLDVTAQTSVSTESEVKSLSIKQKTLEVQTLDDTWIEDLQVKKGFCEVTDHSYLFTEVENLEGKEGNVKTNAKATNSTIEEYLTRKAAVQISTKANEQADRYKFRSVEEFSKTTLKTSFQDVESCRVDCHAIIQGEELESSDCIITSHNLVMDDFFGDDQFLLQATCNSEGDKHEDRRNDICDYQDIHRGNIQPDGFGEVLESVRQHKMQSYRAKENDARDKTVTSTASQKCLMKNPDSDISLSLRDLTLSKEKDKIALCVQGDMICPESQPSASGEQQDFTPVTSTEESLLLVTEEPYDSSSLKYMEISDDKTDHSSIITGICSDFISLESEKKMKKSLHSKLHLRTTGIASHNSKIKYAEDLINLNGGVLSPCKKQERSLSVRAFYATEDAKCDQEKDAEETEQQILSYMGFNVQKKRCEVEIDDRTVRDLQEKQIQYSLRQIVWLPMNSLPLPRLGKDAIVGFVEEQTCDGHGGSTMTPSEHELKEMLRLLASDNVPGPQMTMKYEMLRLCTMKTFPGEDRPFAIRIVGAGFYYAGHQDQVICYCCGNRKDSWVIGDIPLLIHQNMAPDCGFLSHNARVNVPIRKANSSESPSLAEVRLLAVQRFYGSNQSDTAQGESSLMLPSSQQNRRHNVSDNLRTVSANVNYVEEPPPKYPQYAVKNMRINSFQGWPAELQQRPEEMAECGFYYADESKKKELQSVLRNDVHFYTLVEKLIPGRRKDEEQKKKCIDQPLTKRLKMSIVGINGHHIIKFYEKWYLNWSRDHPYFSNEITVLPFGTEPLPPRLYIMQNDYRYHYECVRLATFSQYQGSGFGTRLAQSGFVYDVSRNMVVCPWDGSDVSSEITRNRHIMNCAFVRQFYNINIPLHEAPSPPLLPLF